MLVAAGLPSRECGGQGAVALVDPLVGSRVWSGLGLAGLCAPRAGGQLAGVPVLREGRQGLTGIGVTGTGGAASLLNGVGCGVTLLAPLRVDRAARLGLAALGRDAPPAVRNPAGA